MTAPLSLDGRRFAEADRVLAFREDREGTVTAMYTGGAVVAGTLAGRRDGRDLEFGFCQIERNGIVTVGRAEARLEQLDDGRVRVHESWRVEPSGMTGTSLLEELPGPRWVRSRFARRTGSLPAAVAFYGDVLGLACDGPHPATPDELVLVALPGGGQLELTSGGGTTDADDDVLVLQVPTAADVTLLGERLRAAGVPAADAPSAHWDRTGVTVRDPDGRRVVVAHLPA